MPFPPLLPRLTLTAATLLAACATSHAALLAGWDFQGSADAALPDGVPVGTVIIQPTGLPETTPKVFTANDGVYQSTSNLYFDGTNGSSNFVVSANAGNGETELGALASILANRDGTNLSGAGGVGSLALWNRTGLPSPLPGIDGKSAVFKLSMVGYESLQFSFAVQRPASVNPDPTLPGNFGVSLFTFAYSTDGTTFEPWGVIDTGYATSVINTPFALSTPLNSVNNAAEVFIRMTVSGSTVNEAIGSSNSTRLDNIQFNATAVPEPGGSLLAAGAAALLVFRRGRR